MIRFDVRDVLSAAQLLKLYEMPPEKQKRFVWRVGNELKKSAARNIRQQKSPDGKKWEPRRRKQKKGSPKKMLTGLIDLLVVKGEDKHSTVGFRKSETLPVNTGVLAASHQQGMTTTHTPSKARRDNARKGDQPAFATKHQAKRLRLLGYKRRGKRGNYINASSKWIQENVTYRQAGFLLRELKNESPKKSWRIELPARPFLGATEAERAKIIRRVMKGIDYGWNVKKQQTKGASS
ncbi:phage virion morphogenesis protein [Oceanimonas sp. AH20CE76]|uniref:phage virion morphogenesis protein n=1 Tax=Oceanimonas sp. AH20CE76 TaxID=2977120 RepID=UPI0031FF3F03